MHAALKNIRTNLKNMIFNLFLYLHGFECHTMECDAGIEPVTPVWKTGMLPLHQSHIVTGYFAKPVGHTLLT